MIMTLMRSSNVLQSDYRSGRVYFDCRSHQNQETPANPLPRIGLQYAPTFYIFFIFCIIRYDSDTLYTVTLARIWGDATPQVVFLAGPHSVSDREPIFLRIAAFLSSLQEVSNLKSL